MTELEKDFKAAHKDYYKDVDGPIGGRDRPEWVARHFFKEIRNKKNP